MRRSDSLRESMAFALENMAFVFPDEEVEEIGESARSNMLAAGAALTSPRGESMGSFSISISKGLLHSVAENMLGLGEDSTVSLDEEMDALKELVNVVSGHLMPSDGSMLAGLPQIEKNASADMSAGDFMNVILSAEGGYVEGVIRMKEVLA